MWGLSAYFSEQGFAFQVPALWWIGAILAVGIIVIEVVWNEEGMNHGITIIVAGIFAYTYGISTKVVGILVAQNITTLVGADTFTVCLSIGLGVMLEIVPVALFTWAVTGVRGRDFMSNILPERTNRGGHHGNGNSGGGNNQGNNNQQQPQQQNQNHGGQP